MVKKSIHLNEDKLKGIIRESVKRVLNETRYQGVDLETASDEELERLYEIAYEKSRQANDALMNYAKSANGQYDQNRLNELIKAVKENDDICSEIRDIIHKKDMARQQRMNSGLENLNHWVRQNGLTYSD